MSVDHDHNALYIVDGHRRYKAIQDLREEGHFEENHLIIGRTCTVSVVDYKKSLQLIAQANSEGTEPFTIKEQALLIRDMLAQKISMRKIAKSFGKSEAWVRDRERIFSKVRLQSERDKYFSGEIPLYHLRSNYPEPTASLLDVADQLEEVSEHETISPAESVAEKFEDVTSRVENISTTVANLQKSGDLDEDQRDRIETVTESLKRELAETQQVVHQALRRRDPSQDGHDEEYMTFQSVEAIIHFFHLTEFDDIATIVAGSYNEVRIPLNMLSDFSREKLGAKPPRQQPTLPEYVRQGYLAINDYDLYVNDMKEEIRDDRDLMKRIRELRRFVTVDDIRGIVYRITCTQCGRISWITGEETTCQHCEHSQ